MWYKNNILIPEQHGFRPDLSTTHQLLRVVETIKSGFKNKKSTGAVFLDIQKAFDRVWREGLIFKLIKYDFPPPLIKLISSYLTDRNFSVKINDTYSSHRPTEAGVAQGTLISPLLFNIYVNDIPIHHNTTLCMFADDTAILASHTEPKLVARAINRHLLVLEDWFSKWKIALNVAKTEAVFFTRKTRLNYPDIYLHNERIPWSQSTKYLGVTLDKKLTFKQHITRIRENFIKKALTFSHLISRRSKLSRSNKLLIYSSLLRPVITYASPVWSFAANTHIKKLEVLQNKTLRQILKADWAENVTEFLEGIDNQIRLLEIPSDLSCAYLKGHLLGRAQDWYQIFGSALVQNTATDFAQLKAALSKAFLAIRNKKDLEIKFYASQQRRNEEPTDFVYDLLKLCKKLKLGVSLEAPVDHIFVRLEPQVQDYVEVRNPQNTVQVLEVLSKFEERYSYKAMRGSRNSDNVERRGWNERRMSNVNDN
ncbi:RNA-directed DNA polymerase from mobile element jockey [Trichonephila clavipes]|nr:RNA-directed DNA polymerase from mobile element jockey [Trichonephila clavipes]